MRERQTLKWVIGRHAAQDTEPSRWLPATVPGAVQLDWATAHDWPPLHVGENWRTYAGLEDDFWTYRAKLPDTLPSHRAVAFVCRGVDYAFDVLLDGELIHSQEGMFTPVDLDLTDRVRGGAEMRVRVRPAPKADGPADRAQARRSCKPAVSYAWDFHPRLIPLGIWDETFVEFRPQRYLSEASITYRLNEALDAADLLASVRVSGAQSGKAERVRLTLVAPDNTIALSADTAVDATGGAALRARLDCPKVWWPHDHGSQPLYRWNVELLSKSGEAVDRREGRVGFRRARLVMHDGAWAKPDAFPKGRSDPPITMEINGRRIFCKGANWVSPDIFPGRLDSSLYDAQLGHVRDANMNLLRMWGGAPAQKQAFYDRCDEFGIMVWQEFPLACNDYPDDDGYLGVLERESRAIVRRLREHPSVVLWCGGNELFNGWSGMTDQSLPLRLLDRVTYELDPRTPFLMTSPLSGMGHGHYVFRDSTTGEEAWAMFQKADCTAYTEFGMPSPASVEVLREIIPAGELFPPKPGGSWESHHAFGVWMASSHLYMDVLEHYFGPATSLEQIVARGELLQAEGYRGLYEEARRQKPKSSMALCWCLNEPWPTAANNSLLSWPARPKPALAAVREACRPVLASARVRKFDWRPGETFDPELFLLNDRAEPLPAGRVEAWLAVGEGQTRLATWDHPSAEANTNVRGPRLAAVLPRGHEGLFELRLRVADRPEWNSVYRLLLRDPGRPQIAARTTNF